MVDCELPVSTGLSYSATLGQKIGVGFGFPIMSNFLSIESQILNKLRLS